MGLLRRRFDGGKLFHHVDILRILLFLFALNVVHARLDVTYLGEDNAALLAAVLVIFFSVPLISVPKRPRTVDSIAMSVMLPPFRLRLHRHRRLLPALFVGYTPRSASF